MNHQEIFKLMSSVAEGAQKRGLLEDYKDDFYRFDKEHLEKSWMPQGKFIWVITPNGTHLTEIGIHKKGNEMAYATLNCGYKHKEIYFVSAKGVKEINYEKANQLIQNEEFEVTGNSVTQNGKSIALISIAKKPFTQNFDVTFNLNEGLIYDDWLKHALTKVALYEAVDVAGSFFVSLKSVNFN